MKQAIPVGLIAVNDLIEKHAGDRERILGHELARRERERLLFRGTRKLLHIHIWSSAKAIAVLGLSVFFFVWSVGQIAQVAQWFQAIENYTVTIPVPLRKDIQWNLRQFIPTSTVMEAAASLPLFGWRDAGLIALGAMILLLAEKLIIGFLTWKHSAELKAGERDAEEEVRVLKEWMEEGRVARQPKRPDSSTG